MGKLLIAVAPLALRFAGKAFPAVGRFMARHPWLSFGAVEYETDGAITRNLILPQLEHAPGSILDGLAGVAKNTFNAFASSLGNNGLYAAVPLAAAAGLMSEGVLAGTVMAGLAYLGVREAENSGLTAPGLSLDFGAAASPQAHPASLAPPSAAVKSVSAPTPL